MRQDFVLRDPPYPAGERPGVVILFELLPGRHERFLNKIVRVRGVMNASTNEGEQPQFVLSYENGKEFFACPCHSTRP